MRRHDQAGKPDQSEQRVNRTQQNDKRCDADPMRDKLRQERNVEHSNFRIEEIG